MVYSVCCSLERVSTLPTCHPRVPTTALLIRTTMWACCYCVRWVRIRFTEAIKCGYKQDICLKDLTFYDLNYMLRKLLYLVATLIAVIILLTYCSIDRDFIHSHLMYLHCSKWAASYLQLQVALGDCNELLDANCQANKLPDGKHSTKGLGQTGPDPRNIVTLWVFKSESQILYWFSGKLCKMYKLHSSVITYLWKELANILDWRVHKNSRS